MHHLFNTVVSLGILGSKMAALSKKLQIKEKHQEKDNQMGIFI